MDISTQWTHHMQDWSSVPQTVAIMFPAVITLLTLVHPVKSQFVSYRNTNGVYRSYFFKPDPLTSVHTPAPELSFCISYSQCHIVQVILALFCIFTFLLQTGPSFFYFFSQYLQSSGTEKLCFIQQQKEKLVDTIPYSWWFMPYLGWLSSSSALQVGP